MPDLDRNTWLLIAAAAVAAIVLVVVVSARRGRDKAETEQRVRHSQNVRIAFVMVLLALIVGFALANTETVQIDWLVTATQAPMVVVIGVSGGIGFLAGALVSYRSRPGQI